MFPKKMQGLTLTEVLLVIAIGISIVVLSIRQYQAFRVDADVQQMRGNVDTIFQALGSYYKRECYGTTQPTARRFTPGALHPSTTALTNYPLSLTLLRSENLLTTPLALNPLVDINGTVGEGGYVAQFNRQQTPRTYCRTGTNTFSSPSSCTNSQTIGQTFFWTAQVSFLLADPANATQYRNLLGADCLSQPADDDTILPCSANQPGNYVVWERLPGFATENSNSETWVSNPNVTEFTRMYNTYPLVYLMGSGGKTPTGSSTDQYFLCGG